MTKTTLAVLGTLSLAALSLSTEFALADPVAPGTAALSPFTATRLGHKPRNARTAHCVKKADAVGVAGKARALYLGKCVSG